MAALSTKRLTNPVVIKGSQLPSTQEQVWQGGLACWDTSTGLVKKGVPSTTLIPIGFYTESKLVAAADPTVHVTLLREIWLKYFVNATAGDAVVAANVGGLAYILDDQTAANNDAANTRSVLGRIWKLDANGVLVQLRVANDTRLGGLDS